LFVEKEMREVSDEYWATFSIYDHRSALYRQALILFDRVVIPVPAEPVGSLNLEEIDALNADLEYLEAKGAAVKFDWDPNEFFDWQKKTVEQEAVDGEALALALAKDPPWATRLQLTEKYARTVPEIVRNQGVDSVEAIPVYGSEERYEAVAEDLRGYVAESLVLQIVCKNLPMPTTDSSLEAIIHLREQPKFQDSLYKLREWQMRVVPELLQEEPGPNRNRMIRKAGKDFEKWIKQYEEAMSDATFGKVQTATLSMLAVGTALTVGAAPVLQILSGIAPPLFQLRSFTKPNWKAVANEQCAPAGVVYAARRL
jgi:hypothetical protein